MVPATRAVVMAGPPSKVQHVREAISATPPSQTWSTPLPRIRACRCGSRSSMTSPPAISVHTFSGSKILPSPASAPINGHPARSATRSLPNSACPSTLRARRPAWTRAAGTRPSVRLDLLSACFTACTVPTTLVAEAGCTPIEDHRASASSVATTTRLNSSLRPSIAATTSWSGMSRCDDQKRRTGTNGTSVPDSVPAPPPGAAIGDSEGSWAPRPQGRTGLPAAGPRR